MTLLVDVEHKLGAFRLGAAFESAGPLTVLFGASGSGKTSIVDLVAGLSRPLRGRIVVDGAVLLDTAAAIDVPRHRRRIGYVFQDARLFPHLDVRRNLLYGRWFAHAAEKGLAFAEVVELLGIADLLGRAPAKLSGGERQRVAIGRALLSNPRLILMDEPLAALDEARKADLLPFIERLRDVSKIPILYVSHSIPEVLRLGTDLVALANGRVVATGAPAAVLARLDLVPVAADVEAGSLLDTSVLSHDPADALTTLASPAGTLLVPLLAAPVGTPVRIRIRARDVMLSLEEPRGISALNVIAGRVASVREAGAGAVEVALGCAGETTILSRVTRRSAEALDLRSGLRVHAVIKAVAFERPFGERPLAEPPPRANP